MPQPLANEEGAAVAVSNGFWHSLDRKAGIGFFILIAGGGIVIPLCVMVYSWFL